MRTPKDLPVDEWAVLLHGVMTRELLLASGVPRSDIDLAIRRREIETLYPGVFVVTGAPITWATRVLALLRYVERQARRCWDGRTDRPLVAVTGVTAAVLLGFPHLDRPTAPALATSRPNGSDAARTLHRESLTEEDLVEVDGILVTDLVWTVAELILHLITSYALNVVADLVRVGRLDLDDLWALMAREPAFDEDLRTFRRRCTPEALSARSDRERHVFDALRVRGVVLPLVNHLVDTAIGRVEADLVWPDLRLIVEIDGPHHLEMGQKEWDDRRDAALRARGWTVIRISIEELDAGFAAAIDRIEAAVAAAVPA